MKTKKLVLTALFAALIAAGAFIKIPTPLVPITLQYFFTMLAGVLLGEKLGALSVLVYIALGLCGIPIFTGGGGISYVLSPTFGYLIGFVAGAYLSGRLSRVKTGYPSFWRIMAAGCVGLAAVYLLGAAYYCVIAVFYLGKQLELMSVLTGCILIFIPGDLAGCLVAALIGKRLLPALKLRGKRSDE